MASIITGIDIAITPSAGEPGKLFKFNRNSDFQTTKTRGVFFLAQRVSMNFLTPKGTDYLDPARGTDFASIIGGNISSIDDLAELATLALIQTDSYIKKVQNSQKLSSDEILRSISLEDLTLLEDGAEIVMVVRAQSSNSATAVIQIPV